MKEWILIKLCMLGLLDQKKLEASVFIVLFYFSYLFFVYSVHGIEPDTYVIPNPPLVNPLQGPKTVETSFITRTTK